MILTKTPLRISFAGGGSDYFHDNLDIEGKVIVTTIDKYIYILLNDKHDDKVRVSYSQTENINNVYEINHLLIRETLKFFNKKKGLELVTSADIPSSGSGLGSSSALIVGITNALLHSKDKLNKKKISEIASNIEINHCKKPIGYQDHYSTAFGGFNLIKFKKNKSIQVRNIKIKKERLNRFKKNLLLFYTGINRQADQILKKITNTKIQINNHERLSKLADNFHYELVNGSLHNCGKILDENWILKRSLNKSVSSVKIDDIYRIAKTNGVIGGKLLGAGGGGYFLFYADKKHHNKIIKKLKFLKKIDFNFDIKGTQKLII